MALSIMGLQGLQTSPRLFSTFLIWLLVDLFYYLPEMGDVGKPKLVFFFDEAHLLFDDASKAFLDAVAQTVRLIRSKGVGVFFVTQTPKDVPPDVLAQLGNRVQHALRAFTPDDAKALKATVGTFPKSNVYADLGELLTTPGIGEAAVTILSENRCADAGCLDPLAPAAVADGPARPSSAAGDGGGQSAADGVRHHGGPRLEVRDAARQGGASAGGGPGAGRPAAVAGARAAGRGQFERCARHRPPIWPVQELRSLGRLRRRTRNHARPVRHGTTASCDAPPPVTWPGYLHVLRTNAWGSVNAASSRSGSNGISPRAAARTRPAPLVCARCLCATVRRFSAVIRSVAASRTSS
jgi:hypothetical protein